MKRTVLRLAVIATLVAPTGALAAVRYAASSGGTTPGCPQADPCSLATAISGAAADDEVVVAPGTYPVAGKIESTMPLSVHGIPAGRCRGSSVPRASCRWHCLLPRSRSATWRSKRPKAPWAR
ncbi:MAG: hypothetical protein JST53_09900 [Actinobacteria bacterium]|nr:hypothetical protein [Actinomycetota bacterium]